VTKRPIREIQIVEGRFEDETTQAAKYFAAITNAALPGTEPASAPARTVAPTKGIVSTTDVLTVVEKIVPKSFGVSIGWEVSAEAGVAGGFMGSVGFVADCDVTESPYDGRSGWDVGFSY